MFSESLSLTYHQTITSLIKSPKKCMTFKIIKLPTLNADQTTNPFSVYLVMNAWRLFIWKTKSKISQRHQNFQIKNSGSRNLYCPPPKLVLTKCPKSKVEFSNFRFQKWQNEHFLALFWLLFYLTLNFLHFDVWLTNRHQNDCRSNLISITFFLLLQRKYNLNMNIINLFFYVFFTIYLSCFFHLCNGTSILTNMQCWSTIAHFL